MYTEIEKKAEFYGATIVDFDFPSSIRYAYYNGVIAINKKIVDDADRRCIIALGLGRHLMGNNNSIALSEEVSNVVALHWAVSNLMPFNALIEAKKLGLDSVNEVAEYLRVTPDFFETGIEFYKNTYGSRIFHHDCIIDLEKNIVEPLKEVG